MLSRLSLRVANPVLTKSTVKFLPSAAVTTSSSAAATDPCDVSPATATSGGKRDLVNFPDRVRQEYPPPTRFLFIPEAFFQAMYPKTGVTGPYMLFFGTATYMLSKEMIVIDHNFCGLLSWACIFMIAHYKFGDKIGAAWNRYMDKEEKILDDMQESEKQEYRDKLEHLEKMKNIKAVATEIMKAKREGVLLQMEAAYRERLQEAYKRVKSRLDCQVEMDYVERRIAHLNLHDYVLRNVMKSITPELEKNTLQNCITELNSLASKA